MAQFVKVLFSARGYCSLSRVNYMLYGLSGLPQRLIAMPYIGDRNTIFYIERGEKSLRLFSQLLKVVGFILSFAFCWEQKCRSIWEWSWHLNWEEEWHVRFVSATSFLSSSQTVVIVAKSFSVLRKRCVVQKLLSCLWVENESQLC